MKKIYLYGLLFIITLNLSGQDVEFTVEYPSVVNNGQQFTVIYKVNAGGGQFSVPSFSPFYKLMGPQTSYSSSTQIINGRMSTETSYTYTYYLQAVKEGTFEIQPAIFELKGKEYKTKAMTIEVVAGTASTSSNQKQGGAKTSSQTDNEGVETTSGDLFVNLTLDRKEVYMGEPIMATIKIFTRVDLSGINEIKYPSFNNFLRSDIETPPLTSLQQEDINGIVYGTGVIQRFLLYPQVSGDITIEPVRLSVLVQQKAGPSDPFFGDFFSSYQTVPKAIVSKEMKIKVKPLPGIKPSDFSGIVGKLDLSASIDKDSVNVNDPVNLRITISGTGNLKIAATPQLKLSPDIEVFDPKITDQVKNGANGTTGTKIFEYLLIPRHNGDFVIPPITYSYFNTANGRYETLSTSEFKFHARKSNDQSGGITVFGGSKKEDVKYLGKDIRFIKSEPGRLIRQGNFITSSGTFISTYVFAIFGFLLMLFLRREHIRRNSDLTVVRNRKAGKVAVKRLHAASVCLKNQQTDKFYEEILKAIWGYLSDKLLIPVSELSRTNAATALTAKGINDEKINKMNSILDTCEYARFAPSASGTEAEKIYEEASQFIRSVENSIR